jgi:hypothetical protein
MFNQQSRPRPLSFNQYNRSRSLSFDAHRKQGSFLGRASKLLFLALSLILVTAFTLFGISSCQDNAASKHVLTYSSKSNCEFRFEGVGYTLIENHCGKSSGVYFMTPEGMHTAPLIHPQVSALIQKQGCEAPNQCLFNLEVNEGSMNGQFDYILNGQEGFYSFEWLSDQQPRLVESSSPRKET